MPLTLNTQLDQLLLSGIRRFSALAKATPGCISLTLGEPDLNTDEVVKTQVTQDLRDNLTHYPLNNGQPYVREAISRHMAQCRGLMYAPDEVILTCGATEALYASLTAVLNPGDEVIIPVPAFTLYRSIVVMNRAVPMEVDTSQTDFQLTRELLEGAFTPRTKAVVVASPNNPTGVVLTPESLDVLAEFSSAHDVFVICDDVYGRLVYEPGFQSFAARHPQLRDRTIVCDSFSKPYAMTGWRLGWIAANRELIAQISKVHQYMISSVPAFLQHAACTALETDISPALELYRDRRELVLARLDQMGLPTVRPEGAFYAFPQVSQFGLSSEEFCERAIRQAGVALVPGVFFGAEGYVRLSYCCAIEDIAQGLDRLESFIRTLE